MSAAPTHTININKAVLADFADVKAGRVHRNLTGKDMRRAGLARTSPGQMGSRMRNYEKAGLARLREDKVWELTVLGEAENDRVTAEYEARKVGG